MRPFLSLLLVASLLAGVQGSAAGQATPSAGAGTCGNGLLEAGETCAQCPADCAVQPCKVGKSRAVFAVEFVPPPAPDASTAVLLVGYRSDRLSLPGTRTDKTVQSRLKSPEHSVMTFNDLDYALRLVAGRAGAIPAGQLVTVEFDRCGGAPAPTVADLSCIVEACAAATGPLSGCSCTITALAH